MYFHPKLTCKRRLGRGAEHAERGGARRRDSLARAAMVRASQNEQKAKPLELGAQLMCRWRDNEVKPCEVLERQQNEDTGDWEYCAPAPH